MQSILQCTQARLHFISCFFFFSLAPTMPSSLSYGQEANAYIATSLFPRPVASNTTTTDCMTAGAKSESTSTANSHAGKEVCSTLTCMCVFLSIICNFLDL